MYKKIIGSGHGLEKIFRKYCIQQFAATEEALINRFLNGEKTLKVGIDFSLENLNIIKGLRD